MITASLGSPALVEELQRIGRRTASESVGRAGAGARARAGAAPASLRPPRAVEGADDAVDGGWGASSPEAQAAAEEEEGRDDTAYTEGKGDGSTLPHSGDDDAGAKVGGDEWSL